MAEQDDDLPVGVKHDEPHTADQPSGRGPAVPMARLLRTTDAHTRQALVDALAPVMGLALRAALANCLKRRFIRLNRFFIHNCSAQGLRWHFEALRTDRPFAEIVRKYSLVRPVSQALLIHRRTGLLLLQARNEDAATQDADMVSGMLTAIQDFVHDSFNVQGDEQLDTIQVGGMTVLIERGPEAILVGILRGDAPPSLRQTFRDVLAEIHEAFGDALRAFGGDAAPFQAGRRLLEPCLKLQFIKGDERISPLTGLVLALPLVGLLTWGGLALHKHWRWTTYLGRLDETAGIVVTDSGRHFGRPFVAGLRDTHAPDPAGMLLEAGFAPRDVDARWTPYQALHAEAILAAAHRVLAPPPTVTLDLREQVLHVAGEAPAAWIETARKLAGTVPGVLRSRFDALREREPRLFAEWTDFATRMSLEPGFWIIEKGVWNERYYMRGLRDPLARDPQLIMRECGLDEHAVTFRWEPYESQAPAFVLARAGKSLAPPPTVELQLADRTLLASGEAPHRWLARARLLYGVLQGVDNLDLSGVVDLDRRTLDVLRPKIEGQVFYFLADGQNLWPGQERELQAFLERARELGHVAVRLDADYAIEIQGYVKPTGNEDTDRAASDSLARRMLDILLQQRMSGDRLACRGMGALPPSFAGKRERQVRFRVNIEGDL
jgi:outer membrane protein OmpA-like peptidoglycan-associated protein